MPFKVFVSAGTPADDVQAAFRDSIVNALEVSGLSPRIMGDRDWDYKNPLRGIRRAMGECSGAVVIAYPRYQFPAGLELRRDKIRPIQEVSFPTAWNQIEAAMAYERGLPLLVIAQTGIRQDALFESTGDIRPFWTEAAPDIHRSEGFLGYLRSWKEDVETYAAASQVRVDRAAAEVTIRQLFSSLPWYEGLAVVTTLVGAVVAAASIGYRVGAGQWPFG